MPKYSIIIPIYNRPQELQELLPTLVSQTYTDFEVIVIEDGSSNKSEDIVKSFEGKLNIHYYFKINGGQGFARNYGFERANGDYFIVFDSDCLIPEDYLQKVDASLTKEPLDAYGGPDASLPEFTLIQRAISQSLTAIISTGGIRGNKRHVGAYHPRSFNMGISKEVYDQTRGYLIPFMGEDLEFSTRIIKSGFKTGLIEEAFVYHKRRTGLKPFYKQMNYFGRARINLTRFHPEQLGFVHLFPTCFTIGWITTFLLLVSGQYLGKIGMACYGVYFGLVFLEALIKQRSLAVAALTPLITLIQLFAYGTGLVFEWLRKLWGIDPNTPYIELYN